MKIPTKARPVIDRREQEDAADIVARATRRVQEQKAAAVHTAKKKKTPAHRQSTAVRNEDVHSGNTSQRQLDSRSEVDRDSEQARPWTKPRHLDAPTPNPGMAQKWVRYRAGSDEDTDNLDAHLDQGWRPRKAESVRRGHELTANVNSKYAGYIVRKGLILMEISEVAALQRKKHYAKKAARMTEGIDRNMFKVSHHAMPMLQPSRNTRISTTARRGRLEDQVDAGDAD